MQAAVRGEEWLQLGSGQGPAGPLRTQEVSPPLGSASKRRGQKGVVGLGLPVPDLQETGDT